MHGTQCSRESSELSKDTVLTYLKLTLIVTFIKKSLKKQFR